MILQRKQQKQCKQLKSKNICYNPLKFMLFIFLFLFQGPFLHIGERAEMENMEDITETIEVGLTVAYSFKGLNVICRQ